MKERIVSNWKSTVIGLIILGLSAFALIKGYATWSEVIGFMTLSGLFAWVKDTIFQVKP